MNAICLVFLKFYFAPFAPQCSEQKLTGIVRKTRWKVSKRGQQTALMLAPRWSTDLLEVVKLAVG